MIALLGAYDEALSLYLGRSGFPVKRMERRDLPGGVRVAVASSLADARAACESGLRWVFLVRPALDAEEKRQAFELGVSAYLLRSEPEVILRATEAAFSLPV